MSFSRRKSKRFLILSAVFLFSVLPAVCFAAAYVYVYEVVTDGSTFHTASKLSPDAFWIYNGGHDIICSLKVVRVYHRKDFNQAIRDYNLEEKNVRYLPHDQMECRIPRRRYYWWR
jgi:hypothetical protein